MALFLLTLGGIAIVMAIMSVGVIIDGRCLRGSCGGPDAVGSDGEPLGVCRLPKPQDRTERVGHLTESSRATRTRCETSTPGRWSVTACPAHALAARGESPAAFDWCCSPSRVALGF